MISLGDMTERQRIHFFLMAANMRWFKNSDQHAWRKRRCKALRKWLITKLGGECWNCRTTHDLCVDHIDGRTWDIRACNRYMRWLRYVREYKEGVRLRAACRRCNSEYVPPVRAPDMRYN